MVDAATGEVVDSTVPNRRDDSLNDLVSDQGTLVATVPDYDLRDRDQTTRVYTIGGDDPPIELARRRYP